MASRCFWYYKEENKRLCVNWIGMIFTFMRDGISYGVLVYLLSTKKIELDDFALYFNMITQYSIWIYTFMNSLVALKESSYAVDDIRGFLEMPDYSNREKGAALPQDSCNIRFENVSFHHSNTEINTINHLSFTIGAGEKVAIVGLNGAGKTTLVKLLCGLYAPSEGEIYVNDVNIKDYNIEEYYSLFSVVFQDIHIMPTTIAQNIALTPKAEINLEKLYRSLNLAGLENKVKELPEREDTFLLREVTGKGIDLSGGEKQKLALARALYKSGKLIVLDEPTAALDPIAESEIYQKYNELTAGCTSIFVSHRLASTRFCDNIIFLENGNIVEQGSHEELMELGGRYAELFSVQSQYYMEARDEKQENSHY